MPDNMLAEHLKALEKLSALQQQFEISWIAAEPEQIEVAGKLLIQFEQLFLNTVNKLTSVNINEEAKQELANKLQWLERQAELVTDEKNRLAQQILQLTRAKKGYGSYDEQQTE